jgi:hypothetical protein
MRNAIGIAGCLILAVSLSCLPACSESGDAEPAVGGAKADTSSDAETTAVEEEATSSTNSVSETEARQLLEQVRQAIPQTRSGRTVREHFVEADRPLVERVQDAEFLASAAASTLHREAARLTGGEVPPFVHQKVPASMQNSMQFNQDILATEHDTRELLNRIDGRMTVDNPRTGEPFLVVVREDGSVAAAVADEARPQLLARIEKLENIKPFVDAFMDGFIDGSINKQNVEQKLRELYRRHVE